MCFCAGQVQNDQWFQAAYDNDVKYLKQYKEKYQTMRDIRFAEENIYPGFTAFLYAVYQNNIDAMAVLLEAELTLPSLEPIILAEDQKITKQQMFDMNQLLSGSKVIQEEPSAQQVTQQANKPTNPEKKSRKQKKLEDNEPEYNYREFPGSSTSLMLAVHCGSWDAFDLMMESIKYAHDEFGSLLRCKNEHRETLLHFFVRNGSNRALDELKKTGRQFIVDNLDAESDMGINPILLAIRMGKINFLEYLLSLGYDDQCYEKLKFDLRRQKGRPDVEMLCTPSQMFHTSREDARQALFLLMAFQRRSLPPAPEWLEEEIREAIKKKQDEELLQYQKKELDLPPWLQRQLEAEGQVVEVPDYQINLQKLDSETENKESKNEKDGLLHVYDQILQPEGPNVETYQAESKSIDEQVEEAKQDEPQIVENEVQDL